MFSDHDAQARASRSAEATRSRGPLLRSTLSRASATLIIALASDLPGQRSIPVQGSLSITGGSATDVLGAASRALTVAPSLALAVDPRVIIGVQAAGTKFDNGQWSVAGGASTAARLPLRPWAAVTLNGAAAATGTSYDFSYLTATALPALELTAGRVSGFAGVHETIGSSNIIQISHSPGGLLGLSPVERRSAVSVTRSARAVVYGATAHLGSTTAGLREERGTVDSVPTVDRTASVTLSAGRIAVGGALGRRSEPATATTFGSGSLSIAVTRAVGIELNAGTYPANRLVGTPAGRFVNLGFSMRTGRSGVGRAATPSGVPAVASGMTRLALRDEDATSVEIAGDFTNWKFVAATRAPNGVWFVDLRIPPGQYRYAFRVDRTKWKVPSGAVVSDDDFGGKSAWLTVRGPSKYAAP